MPTQIAETDNISSMPPSLLVSAVYDNSARCAVLKFYEPKTQKIILWKDETGHKPYCYSRLNPDELDFLNERDDVISITSEKKYDLMKDEEVNVSKITVTDPLAIGGTSTDKSIRNLIETWESDIKYYENYLYDRALIIGKYYEIVDSKIKPHDLEISDEVKLALKSLLWDKMSSKEVTDTKQFQEFITEWADLLNQPIPKIRRLSLDIEVEAEIGRIPDPKIAEKKVTAIGFDGTDGFHQIFVLRTEGTEEGKNDLDPKVKVTFYDDEKKMIEDGFKVISEFPFLLTYNGDEFDLPYLYNRAERIGIKNSKNPLHMMRDSATLKHGVHIDLYRTLSNRSFQIYAFSQKYTDFSLNSVSKALLGEEKIDYGIGINDLNLYQTANYCYNDARLTYKLSSFNNDVLMNLLIIIARIGRMPVDDIARMGVSQWIRSLLYYEHRQRNALIPKREELQRRSSGVANDAVIKDKKYRGGLVVDPKEGVHFNVIVMDFACFDDKTEILTTNGWKTYDTLKEGDTALSVNLKTNFVENDPIKKVFRYDYNGDIFRIKTPKKLDFIFTPNHRIVYKTKKGGDKWIWEEKLKIEEIQKISKYHISLPCFGNWIGKKKEKIKVNDFIFKTKIWFEFLGRFLGDGYLSKSSIHIYENIKNQDRISGLCNIITKLGFEPKKIINEKKHSVTISIHDVHLVKALQNILDGKTHSKDRTIPNEYLDYSPEYLHCLLKGLMESDGSTTKSGEKTYTTINKDHANSFQLLALKCGYNCSINNRVSNGFNKKTPYYLCVLSGFRQKKSSFVVSKQHNHITTEQYNGKIWCASTRNTTLIIRRNGRVVVTGNSLYPSIIKVKNLSYETVRCAHEECKTNKIPDTNHWVCTKRNGLTSLIIGSLRDLRVNYYKSLSKKETLSEEQRQQYTVVSQALKVILNASYGVMGAEIFPLYFLPAAEATTAIGRYTILETIKKCEAAGIKVLYGDSVLPDTPIVIRKKDGVIDIVPIQSLMPETVTTRYDKFGDIDVLTERGFSKIKYIYKHKIKKKGYRILTRKGFVECTDDHSLIINGREIKPSELKVGDKINLVSFKTKSTINLNPDLAWLFGFFIAEGTCGIYQYKNNKKHSWRVVNQNKDRLEEARKIIEKDLGLLTTIIDIRKRSATYALVPRDNSKLLAEYFLKQCYRGNEKAIPQPVLNAQKDAKIAFIEGIKEGDGHVDKNGLITIDQIHKTVQAGITTVLNELDLEYSLQIRKDKQNICRIRIIKNKKDKRIKHYNVIKKIERFNINGHVYDLETRNHHFCGGIGNILLHNTDSLFIKDPKEEQIQKVIQQAKKDHGVDLEIDKIYRYCVLSKRKKNYLGVTKAGKVDVKGLTGKKSHTPPFIKKIFYELLDILSKVQTMEDFKLAKKQVSEKIAECGKKVEAKEIPLKDLTFNVMISKAPSEYVKTIPQHIRAAKLLENTREVKKGDIISYVKIINKPGVKPVEMARSEEIDSKKYMEFMESTLNQITSSMDLDFDTILGKPKQTGLDEFFWN